MEHQDPQDQPENPLSSEKPRYLLKGSPLVAGGKARLMSNRKVEPNRAKAREVSGIEASGYTHEPQKALRDEPECVGPAMLDSYAESARFYESLRHQAEVESARESRKLLSAENRVLDAERRAKQNNVRDLKPEFQAMRAMLTRARAGNRTDPPTVLRKLETIEARLDGLNKAA